MEELTPPVGVVVPDQAARQVWRPVDEQRTWRAASSTLALVWVFVAVVVVALPGLAITLWVRGGDQLIAGALIALTVAAIAYAWRFGLHPRLKVTDTQLEIRNPLRTRRVALADVRGVEPGVNGLRIVTADRVHEVWCVQTSSAALREHRSGRADEVIAELLPRLPASPRPPVPPEDGSEGLTETSRPAPVAGPATVPHEPSTTEPPTTDDAPAVGSDEDDEDDEPELVIHRATRDDAATLTGLEQRASEAGLGHVFPPDEHAYPVGQVTQRWDERLADRAVRVRIAEVDGEPVGYLAYGAEVILHLGVAPEQQRRGHGRALLDYATRDIRREHDEVDLWVLRDNETARNFYRAYGFVDTDQERLCVYPPQPVEVKMRLPPAG